ncbi:hypothetical protein AN958_00153 [Leucoagaricus sp. SymC.cos]|nr:hypothetical protein AN958_00153 [Leucoagaricus sp. SymC.cos]
MKFSAPAVLVALAIFVSSAIASPAPAKFDLSKWHGETHAEVPAQREGEH